MNLTFIQTELEFSILEKYFFKNGIVSAIKPTLGYEASARIAKRVLNENSNADDLIFEEELMSKNKLDEILSQERMIKPQKFVKA